MAVKRIRTTMMCQYVPCETTAVEGGYGWNNGTPVATKSDLLQRRAPQGY